MKSAPGRRISGEEWQVKQGWWIGVLWIEGTCGTQVGEWICARITKSRRTVWCKWRRSGEDGNHIKHPYNAICPLN